MTLIYSNLCRLCANSCDDFVPIFEKTGILDFAEKIKSYLHVEIKNSNDANDEPRMCNACHEKIINWDQYAEQVQKVQDLFTSLAAIKDNNEIMEKLNQQEMAISEKNDFVNTNNNNNNNSPKISVITKPVDIKSPVGKVKTQHKKIKMKKPQVEHKESDFSEEDEIPLASQLNSKSEALKNRLKDEKTKNFKPRIKLKITRIREPQTKDKSETVITDCYNDNVEMKEVKGEEDVEEGGGGVGIEVEAEDKAKEKEFDSKDENNIKKAGLQSLFTWECLECHAPVKNWNALVRHCRNLHDCNASVQCVCGKFLQSRASIMKHRMKHTIGYGYKCEFENCNKTFHRQQLLDIHSLSHMPKELQPWMCCKCSRRFHTESLLKQHEKVHLPKEEKLIHPCEVCQKKFCSKSAVSAHIRAVHFGERPFVCDQCGHSFTSKGILHEHLTIHSDVYNFPCKLCSKSFKTKYRLKIHMDTHVETRYQCPICTLTLNTRRTLRMHLLVHRDDKAFQCTICGKAFKRSKDLKNHYNLHTGRRPYVCPFCQRTFANGSNCRSHKRRMHPEELKMYEEALASGQQPVIFQVEENQQQQQEQSPVDGTIAAHCDSEYLEDSNESKSDNSDPKYKNQKYSDMKDRQTVSQVPNRISFVPESEANGERLIENVDKLNLLSPESLPLNLQRNGQNERVKEVEEGNYGEEEVEGNEEELQESMPVNDGEDNLTTNIPQITFDSPSQNVQYPIHNLYAFESSGIPAFPGNPFFRQ